MSEQPRAAFEQELDELRAMILRMGTRVGRAVEQAMQALEGQDVELAQRIIDDDEETNELRFAIEEAALATIARQQPAAKDLRVIVAVMNIVLDLERVGDYAAGIAKTVLRMQDGEHSLPLPDGLRRMHDLAGGMLREGLRAYEASDSASARTLAARDDRIDQQYRDLFRELLQVMAEEPGQTERALYLLFAGHNLERIADRATNVAERVIFTQSGEMEELNVDLEDSDPA